MQKGSLSFGICVLAFCAVGETKTIAPGTEAVWASREDQVTFTVDQGESKTQSGAIGVEDGALFDKVGAGEMKVSPAVVVGPADFTLTVREGSVELEDGETPTLAKPTAILNQAAFWLDAAKNVIETNDTELGSTYVSEWRDCRETKTSAPFDYCHGCVVKVAGSETDEIVAMRPLKATGELGAAVDFQGYGSRCILAFQKPETDAPLSGDYESGQKKYVQLMAYDVFVVHSITRDGKDGFGGWGFLIGSANNAYHPGSAGFSLNKRLLKGDTNVPMESRWWMNGVEFDAISESARIGDYVHDIKHYGSLPSVNSLFHYQTSASSLDGRNGGDLVYEVILFTNRLTETEHAQVRRFLTDKYGKTSVAVAATRLQVGDAAKVRIASGASAVGISGDGQVEKDADVDLTWAYVPGQNFGGKFALAADDAGETVLREDIALEIDRGGTLEATNVSFGTRTALTADDDAKLVKTGDTNVRVTALPDAVKTLEVQGGILTVSPELGSGSVSGVRPEVTITNPDFQLNPPANAKFIQDHKSGGTPATVNGWTVTYSPGWVFGDSYAVLSPYPASAGDWYLAARKFEGDVGLALRGDCQVYTTMTVPEDGRYELSLDLYHPSSPHAAVSFWVGPDLDHLRYIGATEAFKSATWLHKTIPTPRLYTTDTILLVRQNTCQTSDNSYARAHNHFDNFTLKPLMTDQTAFPVPNGDFEWFFTNSTFAANKAVGERGFDGYESVGWTFTQPSWTNKQTVGVAIMEAVNTPSGGSYANPTLPRSGNAQLLIASTGATAKTTFRVPAGTWRLRADLAPWRKWNIAADFKSSVGTGVICASAGWNGETVSLGSISLPGSWAKTEHWGQSFAVTEDTDVELTLTVTSPTCGVIVDNLVLVSGSVGGNLVKDGEFAGPGPSRNAFAAGGWQGDTSRKVSDTPLARVQACLSSELTGADLTQFDSVDGNYEGKREGYAGIIDDCGAIWQALTIPEDGRYRLSYYTRTRYNGDVVNEAQRFYYGGNRFRFELTTEAGVTNVMDETLVASTNWVAHTAVFTAKAGDYKFVIEGLNVPTKTSADGSFCSGWDKRGFVDGVSIVRVAGNAPDGVTFPADFTASVAEGAKLRLGFSGTNKVRRVKLGGKSRWGIISKETYPDYILGEGAFDAEPHGAVILFR